MVHKNGGGLTPAQDDSDDDAHSISSTSSSPDTLNFKSRAWFGMCDASEQMRALHVSKKELEEQTASLQARYVRSLVVYALYF